MISKVRKTADKTKLQIQHFTGRIVFAFIAIMVMVTMLMAVMISRRSGETMQQKTAALISNTTYQQAMNVDNYLQKIKTTASLFFSDESYYMYDATATGYDEFERIQTEKAIENRIQDLGVLENYEDFAVVYSNDHTVGWVSDSTYTIFADGNLYKGLSSKITDDATESGWFSDPSDNHRNLYYVKRLNPNAILFVSFYSHEIESVFEVPKDMAEDMTVRLVDENSVVLYSTNKSEVGNALDENIRSMIGDNNNTTILNNEYLVTSNQCSSSDWSVVCSIPKDVIMKEIYEIKNFTYFIAIAAFLLMVILGLAVLKTVSNPVAQIIANLADKAEHDQLTGLLNKISFENIVSAIMSRGNPKDYDVFAMLDMDNFKSVNDTFGHDAGDKVLERFSRLMKTHVGADALIGRVGGDEFAVFYRFTDTDEAHIREVVKATMDKVSESFKAEFEEEAKSCDLSLSGGIIITKQGEMTFDVIYKQADKALYKSKKSGKNRVTYE